MTLYIVIYSAPMSTHSIHPPSLHAIASFLQYIYTAGADLTSIFACSEADG